MAFNSREVETLLASTGRRCCLCDKLHGIQVHHIQPNEDGGSDDISNAIPLCPNCHDEIHGGYASGRSTRKYTFSELRLHRDRMIAAVTRQTGFVHTFELTTWQRANGMFEISIPFTIHNILNPIVSVQRRYGNEWGEAGVEITINENSNITLGSLIQFAGRCIIK
jgi:HNH endonuclease